jgi:hypothetical protein
MRRPNTVAVLIPFIHVVALIALTLSTKTASASSYTFADVTYAGSNDTLALGINNSGNVTG